MSELLKVNVSVVPSGFLNCTRANSALLTNRGAVDSVGVEAALSGLAVALPNFSAFMARSCAIWARIRCRVSCSSILARLRSSCHPWKK